MNQLHVYTWREGILARVGHDLRLSGGCTVVKDATGVRVTVDPGALRVDGAMKDGRLVDVSAGDRADIEKALREDVLEVRKHPRIEWRGGLDGSGTLDLHGRSLPIKIPARVADGRARGEVELVPSRFGIAPFKALLGALKLQDRVKVVFDVAID